MGFKYFRFEQIPYAALMAVVMTGSEGDTWGHRAGAFHGVFQNILYSNCLPCFCVKGLLGNGMVTGEVLKGSVALKNVMSDS